MNRHVAHESPTKSRIFTLGGERDDGLKVVTTLGADDVGRSAALQRPSMTWRQTQPQKPSKEFWPGCLRPWTRP